MLAIKLNCQSTVFNCYGRYLCSLYPPFWIKVLISFEAILQALILCEHYSLNDVREGKRNRSYCGEAEMILIAVIAKLDT